MAAIGSNISYRNQHALRRAFAMLVQSLNDVALANMSKYTPMYGHGGQFCFTVDGLAPVDDAEADLPRSIGDICLRFSGNAQLPINGYVAMSGNFADPAVTRANATVDWVALA